MRKLNRTDLNSVECTERNVSIDNVARIAMALAAEPVETAEGWVEL